jgi:hypothetical protein
MTLRSSGTAAHINGREDEQSFSLCSFDLRASPTPTTLPLPVMIDHGYPIFRITVALFLTFATTATTVTTATTATTVTTATTATTATTVTTVTTATTATLKIYYPQSPS